MAKRIGTEHTDNDGAYRISKRGARYWTCEELAHDDDRGIYYRVFGYTTTERDAMRIIRNRRATT